MGRYTLILLTVWGLYSGVQVMDPEPAQFFAGVLLLGTTIYASTIYRRDRQLAAQAAQAA